jgi:hypothetical protein
MDGYGKFRSQQSENKFSSKKNGGIEMANQKSSRIMGLFLIIDRHVDKGLMHWADELEKRNIPAVILIDDYMLDHHSTRIKLLAEKGFDIGFSYNVEPFWDVDFDAQNEIMRRSMDRVRSCTKEPMRIFGSKYFAYNENTLKIADDMGLEYLLARGTAGARSVVYKADEYNAKIISVSNVPSKELGTGSLCDESLRCRGAIPQDLKELLLNIEEDRIILVAQTHISGVKINWWNAYQEFFNSNRVDWQSMDTFVEAPILLPNAEIPMNTRADYRTPMPKVPLEDEPDFPFE